MVTIPPNTRPGERFSISLQGQQLNVKCPEGARPGMTVRIFPPDIMNNGENVQNATDLNRPPQLPPRRRPNPVPPDTQMFEVIVPPGVRAGAPFALMAAGTRVLVTCPPNAYPGQKIRFALPLALTRGKKTSEAGKGTSEIGKVRLSYDKDGWTRTIRVTDMKFQWVRMDDKGDVKLSGRFDAKTSAYVRKLVTVEGDKRNDIVEGVCSLVPASEAVVDSNIRGMDGQELVSYADIAEAQMMDFEGKAQWFQDTCQNLLVGWDEGHMRINIRREYLLSDSMVAIMSLGRKDLRKTWRFEFIGEEGIDAGGLAREWFQLVTDEIFDPELGLWQSSSVNQMCMQISPTSGVVHPDDHLMYFRFLGRVMGKALFDRQLVSGHMVRHLYKHLLGWPLQFDDLELVDEAVYNSLLQIQTMGADIEHLCLDFTLTEEVMGEKIDVELVEGGRDVDVSQDNLPEYLEARFKYRMLGRIQPQLTELLLGFYDVLQEPLMTIFDYQELELLMCGLPEIEMEDWKMHTEYSGEFDGIGAGHQVVRWFWEVVGEVFNQELKARLLQFVTGTSGVPSRGFSVLQGNDGNIRKFTIHGVKSNRVFPQAHTCFNRIDLPLYTSKETLADKVRLALQMAATGFDIE